MLPPTQPTDNFFMNQKSNGTDLELSPREKHKIAFIKIVIGLGCTIVLLLFAQCFCMLVKSMKKMLTPVNQSSVEEEELQRIEY